MMVPDVTVVTNGLSAGMIVVVKLEGSPLLCKTDEVGELCLSSGCCATGYWGLSGVSNSVFKVSCSFVSDD